ncbi:hypothetical protein SLEP1_g24686 [Rubroshorea leprosula]|uniref:Uncharacterized protein n=1 Tax=Rubroshorea leprosula TaxID=152421 RepID=A0AAV5JNQ5_9ROSI|nr:hypothetical protein SLEP1_g24686 [Rubroshorea leprosula]
MMEEQTCAKKGKNWEENGKLKWEIGEGMEEEEESVESLSGPKK